MTLSLGVGTGVSAARSRFQKKTYKVCLECGKKFSYSLDTMSRIKSKRDELREELRTVLE